MVKKSIIGAAYACLVGVSLHAQSATFYEWAIADGGNGHYYGLTDIKTDWQSAENSAIQLGGHLVSVTSANEQQFIQNTFLSVPRSESLPLWIGLTDIQSEGQFTWVTGEPLTYTNWKAGEPNNDLNSTGLFNPAGEDYVAMNWEYARGGPIGTWTDTPITGTLVNYGPGTLGPYYGLIELTSSIQTPIPAAVWLFGSGLIGLIGVARRKKS